MTLSSFKSMSFVFVLLILASPAAWSDQVVNGGFETGTAWTTPDNWQVSGSSGASPPVLYEDWMPYAWSGPHTGSRWAGDAADNDIKSGAIYQSVAVNPSSTGRAQVYIHLMDRNVGTPNWLRIGIDPAGGTDPAGAVWSSTDEAAEEWRLLQTPEVTATAGVVTVFLEYSIPSGDMINACFFDDCSLTGTLADAAVGVDPPHVSDLTLTTLPPGREDLAFDYVLTDAEDDDPDADQIAPEFRLGHMLDEENLPGQMDFLVSAQVSTPSATDGDGTGTGTWRIQGVEGGLLHGETDRTATTLIYDGLAPAGYQVTVDIKISDWETTIGGDKTEGTDWEGAGLCLMTRDRSYYYMVGNFEAPGSSDTGIYTYADWSIPGNTASYNSWFPIQAGLPTDGVEPIYYRLVRGATTVTSYRTRTAGAFTQVHWLDVSGTPMDVSEDLFFGIVVNDAVTVNVEYMLTDFIPASEGTGGDGTTGLPSNSTGVPHTYVWDGAGDLASLLGILNVQFKITAKDLQGWGTPDMTDFFVIGGGANTGVPAWEVYR